MSGLPYPVPANEAARLSALAASRLLTDGSNPRFDRLVRLASQLTGSPIALVTLLDEQLQHVFAAHGFERGTMPREEAFCNYSIVQDGVFVVEDATHDPRFAGNPQVTGGIGIRFYAGAPMRSSDGHYLGAVCVIDRVPRTLDAEGRQLLLDLADIASQEIKSRRLIEQYAAAMAERDQLVRALAHDLRSPLGGIMSLSELLGEHLRELDPPARDAEELLDAISASASTAFNVAASTLERALAPSPTPALLADAVDLAALTSDVAVGHRSAAAAKRQRLVVEGTPAPARGDAVRLHHALANLVSNALKFSPPHSTVIMRTGSDARHAWVTVEDEGPGLGPVDPNRLFDLYERGPARPTGGEPSSGLGLSIVRDLARLHGGDVRAESLPGKGARFTVSLPAA